MQHIYSSKVLHFESHLKEKVEQKVFVILDLQNFSQIVRKNKEIDRTKKNDENNIFILVWEADREQKRERFNFKIGYI